MPPISWIFGNPFIFYTPYGHPPNLPKTWQRNPAFAWTPNFVPKNLEDPLRIFRTKKCKITKNALWIILIVNLFRSPAEWGAKKLLNSVPPFFAFFKKDEKNILSPPQEFRNGNQPLRTQIRHLNLPVVQP